MKKSCLLALSLFTFARPAQAVADDGFNLCSALISYGKSHLRSNNEYAIECSLLSRSQVDHLNWSLSMVVYCDKGRPGCPPIAVPLNSEIDFLGELHKFRPACERLRIWSFCMAT